MRGVALAIGLSVLLVACGPVQSQAVKPTASRTSAPAPLLTASPTGSRPVLLVVADSLPNPGKLSLYAENGEPAGTITLQPRTRILGVGGNRVFALAADGATLEAIRRDGAIEMLGSLGGLMSIDGISGFVTDADGTQWLWTTVGSDQRVTIHVAGDLMAPRAIAAAPNISWATPTAWTREGVFLMVAYGGFDVVGYFPFTPISPGQKLDLDSGTLTDLSKSYPCLFFDTAVNGTVACSAPVAHTLRLVAPGGKITDLTLSTPRFNNLGDAYFSADGSLLTVAGATGVGAPPQLSGNPVQQPEQYGTDLVRLADDSIARFGPTGVRPAMGQQSWLPDGRLVLWRPDTFGGPPGLFVLDVAGNGQGPEILTSGTPVGYISD